MCLNFKTNYEILLRYIFLFSSSLPLSTVCQENCKCTSNDLSETVVKGECQCCCNEIRKIVHAKITSSCSIYFATLQYLILQGCHEQHGPSASAEGCDAHQKRYSVFCPQFVWSPGFYGTFRAKKNWTDAEEENDQKQTKQKSGMCNVDCRNVFRYIY